MSAKPGKNSSGAAGKGDARRDNLSVFTENLSHVKGKLPKDEFRGSVILKKNGRTVVKYGK